MNEISKANETKTESGEDLTAFTENENKDENDGLNSFDFNTGRFVDEKKKDEKAIGIFTVQSIICLFIAIVTVVSNIIFKDEFTAVKSEYKRLSTDKIDISTVNKIKNDIMDFFNNFTPLKNEEEPSGSQETEASDIYENSSPESIIEQDSEDDSSDNAEMSEEIDYEPESAIISNTIYQINYDNINPAHILCVPVSFENGFINPLSGSISSPFGFRKNPLTGENELHRGIDIKSPEGTKIHAVSDGVVTKSEESDKLGLFIEIDHGKELKTKYGHCGKLLVKVNETVKKGDIIAQVGSTGFSTGNHLHFELLLNDININPVNILSEAGNA